MVVKDKYHKQIIDKKINASKNWEKCFNRMLSGEKVDREEIARYMEHCNNADYSCLLQNITHVF